MKLTYEQKLNAYHEWKQGLKSPTQIARELKITVAQARYSLRLADKHGIEHLKHEKTISEYE